MKYLLLDDWGGRIHDAKKTVSSTEDDLMCWAAAASNILAWTRWGFPPDESFTDEAGIFQYFQDHWEDKEGYPQKAWEWWFNGIDQDGVDSPGGGFWDSLHAFNDYYQADQNRVNELQKIADYLHDGYGVVIGLICQSYSHYITCWGYEYEKDDQDVKQYLGIYITDSDDDSQGLRYYELTRSGWSYDDWWYFQYYKDSTEFFISEVHALNRYPSAPPSPPSGLQITSSS